MSRGTLRILLGAAPGVGKTYAMLDEGRRRRSRGSDVVIGIVETHGRVQTAACIGDLETVPRMSVTYKDVTFEEMDLDAIIARRPDVVLVDELAHSNVPGLRNAKRYQDVQDLLAAGITVISTLNIQHLASLNDVVEQITGVVQHETIPDEMVRSAEQIELVDMTPEALRRRLAHGNVYAPEKIDAALSNYFREGNLAALRELALLWMADQVDDALENYRERHGITTVWETRERLVVAVTGAPGTERLIRRAARIAQRTRAELLGVHIREQQGLAAVSDHSLENHRHLLVSLGGEYREVSGADIAETLVAFAVAENATQIVLGSSQRNRWEEFVRGSVVNKVIRSQNAIDVHVIAHERDPNARSLPRLPRRRDVPLAFRRRIAAWILVLGFMPVFTVVLVAMRNDLGLSTVLVMYLLIVVVVAAVGGFAAALVAACVGFLSVNWFFTPPLHELTISKTENAFALGVFLVTAGIVSTLVAVAARRSAQASRARMEARTLSELASEVVAPDPLPTMLGLLRQTFSFDGVALLDRKDGSSTVVAAVGDIADAPQPGDETHDLSGGRTVTMRGGALADEDRTVLAAFFTHLATALDRRELQAQAAEVSVLAEADALRSALLHAVSHDLRTPLAGIKASVNSLRQPDIEWSDEQTAEFLETIEDETDRMTGLVENLLDMSRINAGAVTPNHATVTLDEVISAALAGLGPRANEVRVAIADDAPAITTDPALLERIVANLVDNALTHGQGDGLAGRAGDPDNRTSHPRDAADPIRVEVGFTAGRMLIRVIDRGKGIPFALRDQVLMPFQRLDDTRPRQGAGVGLGLAVARGFTHALGGQLLVEDTPSGGTTMVVDLGVAQ